MFKSKRSIWIITFLLTFVLVIAFAGCTTDGENTTTDSETVGTTESTASEVTSEDGSDTTESTTSDCLHNTTEWVVKVAASCTQKGYSEQICSDCGEVLGGAETDLLAHTEEVIPGHAADCKNEGLTDGKKCSVCDTTLVEQVTIPVTDHTELIVKGKAATCTEDGTTDGKICSVCKDVLVECTTIKSTGHVEGGWIVDLPAQIGVEGHKYTECVNCGQKMSEESIPAIQEDHVHVGKEWVTTVPSTCTMKGMSSHLCECGETVDTKELDYAPHTEKTVLGTAPGCTTPGTTDGIVCSICGHIIKAQQPLGKVGHKETAVLGKAATCTSPGTTDGKKCTVCGTTTVNQQVVHPKGHNFTNGSCLSCGIDETYGIWIVDGLGTPMSDIIIKIMKGDERVGMYPYNGEYISLNLENGTYQVVLDLSALGNSYVYDESECTINTNDKTAFITLYKTVPEPQSIHVGDPISKDYDAYFIGTDSYQVDLAPNDYTFFIFAPERAALYTLTYGCDEELTVSYHGSSFFAQGYDRTDISNDFNRIENGIAFNVYNSNVGSDYVFAIKSTGADSCTVSIKEIGDPGTRIEDEPWTPYLEDAEKVKEQLAIKPDGEFIAVDVTDMSFVAVYNEHDGYYHVGDENGAIIFIDLTSPNQYINSIQTICSNQRMGAYIYDANGIVAEKRSYNELFLQYGMPESMDVVVEEPIRVPLTAKLAEAIQQFGNKNSWWAEGSKANIFTSVLLGQPYNTETAWLLFCGYYQ